jgi:homoserine dehydrogenase
VTLRVRPEVVVGDDPLLTVEGAINALVVQATPVGQITIIGPGAGLGHNKLTRR